MIIVILAVLGAAMGSFVGAMTWRIHTKRDFVKERSVCEYCNHTLAGQDLIPVLSWLSLRGKCRYCKKPIGVLAPLLELGMAALFVASYLAWPFMLETGMQWAYFGSWLVMAVGLVSLFVYDLRWLLLPNNILFPLVGIALVGRVLEILAYDLDPLNVMKSVVLGVVVGSGLFYLLFQISGGKWIGGGDVKLGILMGVLLGPAHAAVALLVAFYMATLIVLPLMAIGKLTRKSKVPFGPFLIAGTAVAMLWGELIRDTYLKIAGLE